MNHTQTQGPLEGWARFPCHHLTELECSPQPGPCPWPGSSSGAGQEFIDVLNITKT